MIKSIKKMIKDIDLFFIQELMKICNENNVKEFELGDKRNYIRIVYK
jgi:hypothetical protein